MEKPKTILIADSDPQFLSEWSKILEEEGCLILKATKSTQAIQIIQEEKVDLLIIEAEMPEMKVYDAIPIIRGVDPTLPIIVTAAHNTLELEAKIRHNPIFYYHVKTFGQEELKLAVRNAFERQAASER